MIEISQYLFYRVVRLIDNVYFNNYQNILNTPFQQNYNNYKPAIIIKKQLT